jgi:hypothetical protein
MLRELAIFFPDSSPRFSSGWNFPRIAVLQRSAA